MNYEGLERSSRMVLYRFRHRVVYVIWLRASKKPSIIGPAQDLTVDYMYLPPKQYQHSMTS